MSSHRPSDISKSKNAGKQGTKRDKSKADPIKVLYTILLSATLVTIFVLRKGESQYALLYQVAMFWFCRFKTYSLKAGLHDHILVKSASHFNVISERHLANRLHKLLEVM